MRWDIDPSFALPDGFRLVEESNDFVHLYYKSEFVCTFSQAGAIPGAILKECDIWLRYKRGRGNRNDNQSPD